MYSTHLKPLLKEGSCDFTFLLLIHFYLFDISKIIFRLILFEDSLKEFYLRKIEIRQHISHFLHILVVELH